MSFLDIGEADTVKGAAHGALMTMTGACLAYNIAVALKRPKPNHAVNIVAYTLLLILEAWNLKEHL